jgi:hypothetical protein
VWALRTLPCLQREIGGSVWLLLLSFYGIYYGAYLYLVYKILQSLPGTSIWQLISTCAHLNWSCLTVCSNCAAC